MTNLKSWLWSSNDQKVIRLGVFGVEKARHGKLRVSSQIFFISSIASTDFQRSEMLSSTILDSMSKESNVKIKLKMSREDCRRHLSSLKHRCRM